MSAPSAPQVMGPEVRRPIGRHFERAPSARTPSTGVASHFQSTNIRGRCRRHQRVASCSVRACCRCAPTCWRIVIWML